jgi:hypothetical protein
MNNMDTTVSVFKKPSSLSFVGTDLSGKLCVKTFPRDNSHVIPA